MARTSVVLVRTIRIGAATPLILGNGKEMSKSGGGTLPVMQHGRATVGSVIAATMVDAMLLPYERDDIAGTSCSSTFSDESDLG